jgi:transcriptional regulator with XRE-family HTH domain
MKMTTDQPTLGEQLRRLRLQRKATLDAVAKAIGKSTSYMAQLESGLRTPSLEVLVALADHYQVSVDHLLGRTEEAERSMSDEERLEWAWGIVRQDPSFRYGTRLRSTKLTSEVKRFIVEMYERATGRKLL